MGPMLLCCYCVVIVLLLSCYVVVIVLLLSCYLVVIVLLLCCYCRASLLLLSCYCAVLLLLFCFSFIAMPVPLHCRSLRSASAPRGFCLLSARAQARLDRAHTQLLGVFRAQHGKWVLYSARVTWCRLSFRLLSQNREACFSAAFIKTDVPGENSICFENILDHIW